MATSAQSRRRSSEGATRARGSPASPARRGSATTRSHPGGRRPPRARELCLRAPGGAAAARRPPGEEHRGRRLRALHGLGRRRRTQDGHGRQRRHLRRGHPEHHGRGRPLHVMGSAPRPLARPAVGYWSPAEAKGAVLTPEPAPKKPLKLPREASLSS